MMSMTLAASSSVGVSPASRSSGKSARSPAPLATSWADNLAWMRAAYNCWPNRAGAGREAPRYQRQIQRQAKQDAAEAAERLHQQLAAAEERSARELAQTQALHRAEMEAQQKLHRAEMEAQRELARVERIHLLKQLQKQAMIEVSRAVGAHTQMLATLWNQGASILRIEDRDEREEAMNPIFEQISQVVNDFSVELGNAHLFIEDDRLHHTLNQVNDAALMAIRVAEEVHHAVVEGRAPQPNPIPPVQRLMHARASEARRLAWDLLRTGLDDSGRPTGS
jgi:flagellar motor switch/type III secretory pathway protein FliN